MDPFGSLAWTALSNTMGLFWGFNVITEVKCQAQRLAYSKPCMRGGDAVGGACVLSLASWAERGTLQSRKEGERETMLPNTCWGLLGSPPIN